MSSSGLNRVMLIGNLGADPELRNTGSHSVLKLRLAASETYLDTNRVRQERTEWVDVDVWGRRGEALARFLARGSRLYVEGSLRTSKYEDRDGNTRYRTSVTASNVILCGSSPGTGGGSSSRSSPGAADYAPDDYTDDDIPF